MLTATRRRPGSPALLAIGLLCLLPAMAEAQLFPNMPIKRQRESCAAEPPFYSHVKRNYYGYFPTCWSKFPEGWACPCPNPELPNAAASFEKIPRGVSRDPGAGEPALGPAGDDRAMPNEPPANDPAMPPVPDRGRSPFELDPRNEGAAQPGATDPSAPDRPATPNPPSGPGANPSVPPANRIPPPTSLLEMPSLPAVSPTTSRGESHLEPGSIAMTPEATLASNAPSSRPDLGPLPSAPMPNPGLGASAGPDSFPPPTAAAPAQAPQRRSLLGGLFGSGNRRRR